MTTSGWGWVHWSLRIMHLLVIEYLRTIDEFVWEKKKYITVWLFCVLSLGNFSKFHREWLDSAVKHFLASHLDPCKAGKPSRPPDKWVSSVVHAASKTGRPLINHFIHFTHSFCSCTVRDARCSNSYFTLDKVSGMPQPVRLLKLHQYSSHWLSSIFLLEYPEDFFAHQVWLARSIFPTWCSVECSNEPAVFGPTVTKSRQVSISLEQQWEYLLLPVLGEC